MKLKLEDTALERKTALEKTKMKASINEIDLSELQELGENIGDAKRLKREEQMDEGTKDK